MKKSGQTGNVWGWDVILIVLFRIGSMYKQCWISFFIVRCVKNQETVCLYSDIVTIWNTVSLLWYNLQQSYFSKLPESVNKKMASSENTKFEYSTFWQYHLKIM